MAGEEALYQTPIMRRCWETGSFWYFQALHVPKGLYWAFNEHIQRMFCPEHCGTRSFDRIVAPYWCLGAADVIETKIKEEEMYKDRLRDVFAAES